MSSTEWPTGLFVSADWLEKELANPNLRIIQVGGENYYHKLHLPGAALVGYADFTGYRDGVPGCLPEEKLLQYLFSKLGIDESTHVVAYDATGGQDASRFIWSLASMGHTQGYVLDGGMGVWYSSQRVSDHKVPEITPTKFKGQYDLQWYADTDFVKLASEGANDAKLLDVRSEGEYVGQVIRGPKGHIAGAQHMDWVAALTNPQDPRLQDDGALRDMLAQRGIDHPDGDEVVIYCQTAHRAAHTWALLRHLGYAKVKLYDGSISEWGMQNLPLIPGNSPH
uniref:Putative thiosulfate sulfurtransferase n=1 Tax=Magnetococcus massalia (strain MO-1) TaxID=451514 RepID=A0A1S7LPZ1_MAGMO|nr:Putative thiosulfate sulfurtransferase [Candidatus Magnetococcus massalia]